MASLCPRCYSKSWRNLWQPAVDVSTGFSPVSYWCACSMPVWGRRQNPDPAFHQYLAGLLQLTVLRQSRWFDERPAVSYAAAHLITGVRQCEHIMPALCQLCWLPVRRQVDFKISSPPRSIVRWLAPLLYLADKCTLVTAASRHPLWSAVNQSCLVKRSRNQFSDPCFATTGSMLCNSLPKQLRQLDITFGAPCGAGAPLFPLSIYFIFSPF